MGEKVVQKVNQTNSLPGGEIKNGQVPVMHNPPPPPKNSGDKN